MPAFGVMYSEPSLKLGSGIQPPFAGDGPFKGGLNIGSSLTWPVIPFGGLENVVAGEKDFGAVLGAPAVTADFVDCVTFAI